MQPVFADPKTDFVFKRIFGTVEHKSLLISRAGLVLTQEEQARIAACKDIAALDRWFDNALAAKTVADVFS